MQPGAERAAALEAAQTQYDLRAVELETVRQNLQRATLRAPFDGLISRVLVDREDYGATNLARLLFSKKLMVRPEFYRSTVELDPATYNLFQNDGYDAYLITGKNAMRVRKDQFSFAWDLTLAWYEFTRLPYVIHCWVSKRGIKLLKLDKELGDLARRNEAQG